MHFSYNFLFILLIHLHFNADDDQRNKGTMINKTQLLFLILLNVTHFRCQSVEQTIQKMAIDCSDFSTSDPKLYAALKNYKFICVGEMHGTKEPAEFLTYLAKTFVSNNRSVIVGFEISDHLMENFNKQRDSVGLLKTKFFSNTSDDGRGSEAWFNAINDCNKLGVTFCFFDAVSEQRDLGMFEKLLACYQADSNSVILTLSGNIHNKLIPFNNSKTIGYYLQQRFGAQVCAINHIYNGGTMYTKTSDGLKVHTLDPKNGVFSTATAYKSYYLPNLFNMADYSAFFYTRLVTASLPKNHK